MCRSTSGFRLRPSSVVRTPTGGAMRAVELWMGAMFVLPDGWVAFPKLSRAGGRELLGGSQSHASEMTQEARVSKTAPEEAAAAAALAGVAGAVAQEAPTRQADVGVARACRPAGVSRAAAVAGVRALAIAAADVVDVAGRIV